MLPLCKIASPKNNSGVRCQLGGQNITLYLIWLGTPHGTPHCPSAIVQARSSCLLLQALSYLLLPSCTAPLACLPSQIPASPLSQCQGCCASGCRCGPMHSSSAWLRMMWYGLREVFFCSHCLVGEQLVGLGQPEVTQEVRLDGDDGL